MKIGNFKNYKDRRCMIIGIDTKTSPIPIYTLTDIESHELYITTEHTLHDIKTTYGAKSLDDMSAKQAAFLEKIQELTSAEFTGKDLRDLNVFIKIFGPVALAKTGKVEVE